MSFKITGIDKVQKNLDRLRKRFEKEARDGLRDEAEKILSRAKNLAPVKTGRLRDSGRIKRADTRTGPGFEISFSTEYAARVHEEHPTKRKFLQRSALENPTLKELARRFDKVIKRGRL